MINDGTTTLNTNLTKLSLDGTDLITSVSVAGDICTVTAPVTSVLAKLSTHVATIHFSDNVNGSQTNTWSYLIKNNDVIHNADYSVDAITTLTTGRADQAWGQSLWRLHRSPCHVSAWPLHSRHGDG